MKLNRKQLRKLVMEAYLDIESYRRGMHDFPEKVKTQKIRGQKLRSDLEPTEIDDSKTTRVRGSGWRPPEDDPTDVLPTTPAKLSMRDMIDARQKAALDAAEERKIGKMKRSMMMLPPIEDEEEYTAVDIESETEDQLGFIPDYQLLDTGSGPMTPAAIRKDVTTKADKLSHGELMEIIKQELARILQ